MLPTPLRRALPPLRSLISAGFTAPTSSMPKAASTPAFPLNGLFPIAKPAGPASMRIIDAINPLLLESRLFDDPASKRAPEANKRKKNMTHHGLKVGQGGTLDPLADGVLVIGVNRGTKHLNRFLECSKEYEAIGLLGATTTSYDAESPLLSTGNFDGITREDIERVLDRFQGKIKQTPPIFSALKMDGKPLYEYARESIPLPRAIPVRECDVSIEVIDFTPAEVTPGDGGHTYRWPEKRLDAEEKDVFSKLNKMVHDAGGEGAEAVKAEEVDLAAPELPEVSATTGLRPATFKVRMTVSSGTYVRSIVHDIGVALGCGAHVVSLTRTRQGEFVLHGDEDQLAAIDEVRASADAALAQMAEKAGEGYGLKAEAPPAVEPTPETATGSSTGPTTGCIPWSVFERAIAERDAEIKSLAQQEEEAAANMTTEELKANFGRKARIERNWKGELKEWEIEVLRRFVPVPVPVVHDSKSRGHHGHGGGYGGRGGRGGGGRGRGHFKKRGGA